MTSKQNETKSQRSLYIKLGIGVAVVLALGITLVTLAMCSATSTTGSSTQGGLGSELNVQGTQTVLVDSETKTLSGETVEASSENESAVRVMGGGTLTASALTVNTTGETSSADASNFNGINAGIVTEEGSTSTLDNVTVSTTGEGANGVFSTGEGANVTISNSKITTTANSARGLDATYGGTINASDVEIATKGTHCAAIATDRGNGTITATSIAALTEGVDSPNIYSTGDITVANSKMESTGSEAAAIEGKNSITIKDTSLTGSNKMGVMIYQSNSGDAADSDTAQSVGSFTATDSSITSKVDGPMFYVTNTTAEINLENTTLFNAGSTLLLACYPNEKYSTVAGLSDDGAGAVTLNATKQTLEGAVTVDKISSATLNLKSGTAFTGSIDTENSGGATKLVLATDATWSVTADSYLDALTNENTACTNIQGNGHTIYYDASNSANSWLGGKTISLAGGGSLAPM